MQDSRIKYSGVVYAGDDYSAPDGQLAMCHNIINKDGALIPICQPSVVIPSALLQSKVVIYVHKCKTHTHYIATADGLMFYIDSQDKLVMRFNESPTLRGNINCRSIGNILIACDSESLHYWLWREGSGYDYLGTKLPELNIAFSANSWFKPMYPSISYHRQSPTGATTPTAGDIYSCTLADGTTKKYTVGTTIHQVRLLNSDGSYSEVTDADLPKEGEYSSTKVDKIASYNNPSAYKERITYTMKSGSPRVYEVYHVGTPYYDEANNLVDGLPYLDTSTSTGFYLESTIKASSSTPTDREAVHKAAMAPFFNRTKIPVSIPQPTDVEVIRTISSQKQGEETPKKYVTDAVWAVVNKNIAEQNAAGMLHFPHLLRYAYRLFDGSLVQYSDPILIYSNDSSHIASTTATTATAQSYPYMLECYIDPTSLDLITNKWKDIISGIVFFISEPIYDYKQSADIEALKYVDGKSAQVVMPMQTSQHIIESLQSVASFYKLSEIDLSKSLQRNRAFVRFGVKDTGSAASSTFALRRKAVAIDGTVLNDGARIRFKTWNSLHSALLRAVRTTSDSFSYANLYINDLFVSSFVKGGEEEGLAPMLSYGGTTVELQFNDGSKLLRNISYNASGYADSLSKDMADLFTDVGIKGRILFVTSYDNDDKESDTGTVYVGIEYLSPESKQITDVKIHMGEDNSFTVSLKFYGMASYQSYSWETGAVNVPVCDASATICTGFALAPKSGALSTLLQQEHITDDFYSHNILRPSFMTVYNSRLSMCSISKDIYAPRITPFCGWCELGNDRKPSYTIQSLWFFIEKDGQQYVVKSKDTSTLLQSALNYLYYPDRNCKRCVAVVKDSDFNTLCYSFPMTPLYMLNGSAFVASPPSVNIDMWQVNGTDDSGNTVFNYSTATGFSLDNYIDPSIDPSSLAEHVANEQLPNLVATSNVNNPFAFSAENYTNIGNSEVLCLASASMPISQGQFGQHPLYAFTSNDGIWAISIGEQGQLIAVQPVSRDTILSTAQLCQADSDVVFTSPRGVVSLAGNSTQVISTDLDGNTPDFSFNSLQLPTQSFASFCNKASFAYDYKNQRIVLYNSSLDYAYVYGLKTGTWSTMDSQLLTTLNSYPEAYCFDRNGNLVDISNTDSSKPLSAVLVTRPFSMDLPDTYKTIHSVIQRGVFQRGHVKSILLGSRDMLNWRLIWSSKDHYLRHFGGTPYKQFRLILLSELLPEESLYGATIQFTPRIASEQQ